MSTSALRLASAGSAGRDRDAQAREAVERGDHRAALVLLMDAHGPAILRYCERMVGDLERARDLRQVVFVQAFQGMHGFAGRSSLRSWLFGIARHRCLDEIKARGRRRDVLCEEPEGEAAPAETGEERAWLVHATIVRCLRGLEVRVRDAVLLRLQDGFTFPELEAMLEERAGTIEARVRRGSQRLRQCLDRHGVRP